MVEEENMMDPEAADKPRLHCFKNGDRVCGPDCMAFLPEVPREQDYVGQPWANCLVLINEHRTGKHLVILANVLARIEGHMRGGALPLPPPPVPK